MAILYPTSLANLVVEVGTRHSHQTLLLKISDWLTVNNLSLNVDKTKYMIFHNYQRVIANEDIPDLQINDKKFERVSCFNFLGLTINEFMNYNAHTEPYILGL